MSMVSLAERLDPTRAVLVVIDMQNDFCDQAGLIHQTYGLDISASDELLPRLRGLIDSAHRAEVPVIFTQMVNDASTESPAFRSRRLVAATGAPVCRGGSWGAELWGVQPAPGDVRLQKHRHSAFHATDLDLRLRSMRRDVVVLTGVNTNVCVEATARDACTLDYWTLVVGDATGAYTPEEHRSGLHNVDTYFGLVINTEDVLRAWGVAL